MYIFDLLMIECSAGSLTMCNIEFIYNTQSLWENHTTEALLSIMILYILAFLTIESPAVLFYNVYYWIDIQYSRYMGKSHPRCTLVNPDHAYFRLFNDCLLLESSLCSHLLSNHISALDRWYVYSTDSADEIEDTPNYGGVFNHGICYMDDR